MNSISNTSIADIKARFPLYPATGLFGLELFPTALTDQLVYRRKTLRGLPFIDAMPRDELWPAAVIDSPAQVKIVDDSYT